VVFGCIRIYEFCYPPSPSFGGHGETTNVGKQRLMRAVVFGFSTSCSLTKHDFCDVILIDYFENFLWEDYIIANRCGYPGMIIHRRGII